MKTARIGSLEVSVIGLGCNNFGRALDAAGSAQVVNAALDAGMTFFDTASNYGEGRSESYLGAALGQYRSEVIIGTKFGVPVSGVPGSGGADPAYVQQAAERSLRELATDYIDLFQLHKPDPDTPIADTLAAMNELVTEGKVLEIGCSNFTAAQLAEAHQCAANLGGSTFVSNQVEYSLVHRDPDVDGLAEVCLASDVALLPFYPLASGLLTGKTKAKDHPQGRLQMDRYQRFLTDDNFDLVARLGVYAAQRDVTMAQVALGWLRSRPAVPSVTPGATTPEQVASNAGAAAWTPTAADLAALDELLDDRGD